MVEYDEKNAQMRTSTPLLFSTESRRVVQGGENNWANITSEQRAERIFSVGFSGTPPLPGEP